MKNSESVEIKWSNIDSSMIDFIHYKYNGKVGMLGVTFKNSDSYIYNDVAIADIIHLIKSDSIGSTFTKYIRTRFSYKNIGNCNGVSPLDYVGFI